MSGPDVRNGNSRGCALRLLPVLVCLLLPFELMAQEGSRYRIEVQRAFPHLRESNGKEMLHVTVQFQIHRTDTNQITTAVGREEIVVKEDGSRVAGAELHQPRGREPFTVVLVLDVSGSMAEDQKIQEAQRAAKTFLERLHPGSDVGLILFHHKVVEPVIAPLGKPEGQVAHREKLKRRIEGMKPLGGTASLDATIQAVRLLKDVGGRRAVILMTDGQDHNSKATLSQVIRESVSAELPVYALGVGKPGKGSPVTTVLAVDASLSMRRSTGAGTRIKKIVAAKRAAHRFVDLMKPGARAALLPFHDQAHRPKAFPSDRKKLKQDIRGLQLRLGTRLYDAIYEASMALQTVPKDHRRSIVVLTDGKDSRPARHGSRHTLKQAVDQAILAEVPLYLLSFGTRNNEKVMREIARKTGGKYFVADSPQKLLEIYETLAIQLHDDGIDEKSLRRLAEETGGKYYPARDISKLSFIYEELAEELQSSYTVTFASQRPEHDGTVRGIDILIYENGKQVSDQGRVDYSVPGMVVVPKVSPVLYISLLGALIGLLYLPAGFRHFHQWLQRL